MLKTPPIQNFTSSSSEKFSSGISVALFVHRIKPIRTVTSLVYPIFQAENFYRGNNLNSCSLFFQHCGIALENY